MKVEQAQQIVTLSKALDDLTELEVAIFNDTPKKGYDRIAVVISLKSIDDRGSSEYHAEMELDIISGELLVKHMRPILEKEFKRIGGEK